jgi:hypothetical protein
MPPNIPKSRVHLLAARVHVLGPAPLAELFIEILAGANPHDALERYAGLEHLADFIAALGGDRLPQPRVVAGGGR